MRQVLQTYRTGQLSVADVPAPGLEPGSLLVLTKRSLISVGTERQVMDLAKRSLVGKARARPDLVKKVLERLSRDGLLATGFFFQAEDGIRDYKVTGVQTCALPI